MRNIVSYRSLAFIRIASMTLVLLPSFRAISTRPSLLLTNPFLRSHHYHHRHHLINGSRLSTIQVGSSSEFSSASSSSLLFPMKVQIDQPESMEDFGALLSKDTTCGDIILLDGDLGAGKTCFSRGFIRERLNDPRMRVTSPTFLLSNVYYSEDDDVEIHHMDVYRLGGSEDLTPLDLPRVFSECIALIEWPSRLDAMTITEDRLEIVIEIDEESEIRYADLTPHGKRWEQRLAKLLNNKAFDAFGIKGEQR